MNVIFFIGLISFVVFSFSFIGFPIFLSFITPKGPRLNGNLDSFSKCFCQMVQLYSISMPPVIELKFFLTSSMK